MGALLSLVVFYRCSCICIRRGETCGSVYIFTAAGSRCEGYCCWFHELPGKKKDYLAQFFIKCAHIHWCLLYRSPVMHYPEPGLEKMNPCCPLSYSPGPCVSSHAPSSPSWRLTILFFFFFGFDAVGFPSAVAVAAAGASSGPSAG